MRADEVGEEAIPAKIREQLFLMLREAVRNAVHHSRASKVSVAVSSEGKKIVAVVEDDGRGFDSGKLEGRESGGLAYNSGTGVDVRRQVFGGLGAGHRYARGDEFPPDRCHTPCALTSENRPPTRLDE